VSEFPTYSFGYYGLSKIHRLNGETKLAIAENDRCKELMADSVFSLLSEAESYAADGQEEVARQKIDALEKMSSERYVSPYQLALAYCFLGDTESAIEKLRSAAEIKEAWVNWLGVEPAFDPIRSDKRFDDVLELTGYRMFFKNFSKSAVDLDKDPDVEEMPNKLHDLTTLVIEESDKTDDGIKTVERARTAKWPFAVMAVMVLIAIYWGGYHFFIEQREPGSTMILAPAGFQNPSIVVVPFSTDDKTDPNVGVGFADSLTQKLGSIKALRVLSASSGRAIDPNYPKEVWQNLNAAFVLKGTLTQGTDSITVHADLVNTLTGSVLWGEEFVAPGGDLSGVQPKIAEKLWTSLRIEPLPLERQQIAKTFTSSPGAYQQYLVGRSLMANRSAKNLRSAIDSFAQALKVDPEFVLAYIGMADAYALLNLYDIDPPPDAYEKAKLNIQRALQIDESLAEAHATLAYVKFYGERHRETAELEFRRADPAQPRHPRRHIIGLR
jgi:TolB-like protein/Tfp pilus assembly protein PilF